MEQRIDSGRDTEEDTLRDMAHDAFLAFWRAADTDAADERWAAYCAVQERYDQQVRASRQARIGAIALPAVVATPPAEARAAQHG
jgi:DNA-directed RNA polymerase specialized sigma24 family protein